VRLVVSKNRKNWNVEVVFEVGVELGDGVCVFLDAGFPNAMSNDISGVVDVVEVLTNAKILALKNKSNRPHLRFGLSHCFLDQVPRSVGVSVVSPIAARLFRRFWFALV
jgi:hypothetical protein